jgi:MFS superfamily sulfate permease-like transporter
VVNAQEFHPPAFATIAGLPPEYGLYTAMVTPIIAALFGFPIF